MPEGSEGLYQASVTRILSVKALQGTRRVSVRRETFFLISKMTIVIGGKLSSKVVVF